MTIHTHCPCCGKAGSVPRDYFGKHVRCKQCSASFVVQGGSRPVSHTLEEPSRWRQDMPAVLVDVPFSSLIHGGLRN